MKRRFLFVFVLILCLASSAAMADFILPAGIKTIEPEAFMNDVSINEVVLPDGVETIGSKAFYGCEGLEAVTIGSGVTEIGKNAFYGCTGLTDVYYGGTQSEWDDISIASGNDALLGAELHIGLAAPTGVGIEAANTDYYCIWWDQMPDATGYRIYSSENSSVSKNSDYTEYSPDNTYTFFVLYPGQQRYFAMSALYGNEESQLTAVMTDTPLEPMPAPQNARVESVDADGIVHLAWDAVPGAANYRIFYSSSPEYDQNNWHIYTESDQPSFDFDLDECELNTDTVYFWITVQTDLGPGYPSEMVSVSFIPVTGGFAWLTDCYIISWDEVPGVTGYRVYYGTDSYVTKECPYYEQGADETVCYINTTPGVQYYFAVSALFADSESGLSAVITDTPVPPLPAPEDPMIVSADADGQVYLQWSAVDGADNYRVYCSDDPVFNPADECYVLNENATELSINLALSFDVTTDGTCYLWIAADTGEGPGRPSERLTLNWMEYTVYQLAAPVLQQVCQDGMGGVTLSWNAFGSDYLYQVYGGRSGTTPRLIATTRDASCTVQTVSNGQYTYYVCAGREDSSGYAVYGAMSDPLSVSVQRIWQAPITLYGVTQTDGQSCVMTWSELTPKTRYEGERLWPDGSIETQFACDDLSFDFDLSDDETYTYRVRAYYTKNGIDFYSPWSNTVVHRRTPPEEFSPDAPELVRYPSSDDVRLYGGVELAWIPNSAAESVYIIAEKAVNGGYEVLAEFGGLHGTTFTIPDETFSFIPANTQAQIRLSVGSEGVQRGEAVRVTFSMYGRGSILLNGQAGPAVWDRPYRTGSEKTFAVTAGESWTVSSSAPWLQAARDGDELLIRVSDNPDASSRTGIVTVFCEDSTQTVTVAQGTVDYAPALYLSDGTSAGDYLGIPLSQDQSSPTPVNYKSFTVNIDHNNAEYVQIKWYFAHYPGGAVTDSGTWTSKTYGGIPDNIGAVYCLETSARMADNAVVADGDSPAAKYYYVLTAVEDFLLLDGQENTTIYGRTQGVAKLAASDDVTWQSDANWITAITEEYRNTPNARRLSMTFAENTTGANRTGHVTVTCGNKSGVITVVQIPNVPKITSPSLSTSSGSPTTLSNAYCLLTVSGTTEYAIEEYINSSWSSVMESTASFEETVGYVGLNLKDEIGTTSATKFRFVLTDDAGHTAYYYFQFSSSSSSYVYLGTKSKPKFDTYLEFDVGSAQETKSFYMAASGSWTSTSSASWLSISPASGSSTTSQSVTLTAQNNTTGAVRTAKISFKISETVYAECKVTQTASDQLTVTYDGLPVEQTTALSRISPSNSVSVPLKAYGTSTVTAASDVTWITVGSSNKITVAANTGAARTGHVTFTCGSASQQVTLTQLSRLAAVTINSPALSADPDSPTFITYTESGLTLSWNRVNGTKKYELMFRKSGTGNYTRLYVNDTGSSTYTYTIPASYFDAAYTGKYDFRIFAVDERGNVGLSSGLFFFTCSVSGGALLDGKNAQTWNSVNDLGDSKSYVIASSAGWTASANASWIHFNPASGSSGEVLTVTLDQNPGAQRTGKVTVTCGGGSAVLNITQCAALAAYPEITSPALSLYKSSPAMFAKTDSLTVTWQTEPQVGFYEIDLCEASGHVVQHASGIKTGTYTFDTGALIPGRIYMIEILRNLNVSRSGNYAADYYFCYTPDSAELTITSSHSSVMDDLTFIGDGSEENAYYDVSSSGTWIATVSDPDWIMLSRRALITAEYLAEAGENSSDYRQLIGEDGTSFRLCLLANETGASRSGTVTVTTPGASVTFEVTQSASYMLPAITSPYISSRPGTAESLPYGDIALTWNKGSGTTGVVTLTLFENGNAGYVQVWKAAGLTGTSATVPGSVMQERTGYRLRVETMINNLGESDYRNYYFSTGAANALALNATVDWSQALYGGAVTVRASAYGGAGNYRYDYQLLHNGQIESESGFETFTYYSFWPSGTGTYQLRVIVRDDDYEQAEYTSTWEKTDTNVISVAVASQYVANLNAQSQALDYTIISNGTWTVTEYPYWVELLSETGDSGSELAISVGANQGVTRVGRIIFESSTGVASTLTITQVGSGSASQPGTEPLAPEIQDLPPVDYAPVQVVLQSTEIMVGEKLVADVTAYGATAVRLVVDNRVYEEYSLENGQVHVERTIHQSGIRQIQFQAYLNGNWSEISVPQTLTVNEQGQLSLPSLSVNSSGNIGEDITISIPTVANADTYYLTILLPDSTLPAYRTSFTAQELLAQNNLIPISGDYLLQTGEYYADVLVSGQRYSQNENGRSFTLTSRQYDTQILTPYDTDHFVMGDTISVSISQSGGGYAAIAVKGKNGTTYYPDNENNLTTQAAFVQTITLPEAGDYEITSYVYATDGKAALNVPQAKSQTIHITLDGPIITDVQVETRTGNKTWADAAPKLNVYISTNNAVDEVEIIENGQRYPARFVDEIKYVKTFAAELTNAAACLHQIHVIAKDKDLAGPACAETDKSFYVAQKIDDSESYPVYPNQDRITLYSSPYNGGMVTTAVGGALFETLWVTYEADHWYRVRNAEKKEGFVSKDVVSLTLPAASQGKVEIIQPRNGQIIHKGSVIFKLQNGIANATEATVKFRNLDSNKEYTRTLSGMTEGTVNIESFDTGRYRVTVVLSSSNSSATVESTPINIIVEPSLSALDEEYRMWLNTWYNYAMWFVKPSVYHPQYDTYLMSLDMCKEIHDFTTSGTVVYEGSVIPLFNPETVPVFQQANTDQQKMYDIVVLGQMLQDESDRRYVRISNMSPSIQAYLQAGELEERVQANIDLITAGADALSLTIKTHSMLTNYAKELEEEVASPTMEKVKKVAKEFVDIAIDSAKEMITDAVSEYDSLLLLKAYKREYADILTNVTEENIQYLEDTLFSYTEISDMDRLEESALVYINAYRDFLTKKDTFPDAAVNALMNYPSVNSLVADQNGNLDYSKLQALSNHLDQFIWAYLTDAQNWEVFLESILEKCSQEIVKAALKKAGFDLEEVGTKYLIGQLVSFINKDFIYIKDGAIEINYKKFLDKVISTLVESGFTIGSAQALYSHLLDTMLSNLETWEQNHIKICDTKEFEVLFNSEQGTESAKLVWAMKTAVEDIIKTAWKLGTDIEKTYESALRLRAQCHGQAAFEANAAYITDNYAYQLKFAARSNLYFLTDNDFETMSIQQLENVRAALITLLHSEEMSLRYLKYMWQLSKDSGWKFTLKKKNGETYRLLEPDGMIIDDDIEILVDASKKLALPSKYMSLVNGGS